MKSIGTYLKELVKEWGPVTVVLLVLVIVASVIGGVVVIAKPTTLSFSEYLSKLQAFAFALGGLAIGRGVLLAGQAKATATVEAATISAPTPAPEVAKEAVKQPGIAPHPRHRGTV